MIYLLHIVEKGFNREVYQVVYVSLSKVNRTLLKSVAPGLLPSIKWYDTYTQRQSYNYLNTCIVEKNTKTFIFVL